MPSASCTCPCGCRIRRTVTRSMFGMPCYPCATGHHNLRDTGYPFPPRRNRVGINPIGPSAPATSAGAGAPIQEGSE